MPSWSSIIDQKHLLKSSCYQCVPDRATVRRAFEVRCAMMVCVTPDLCVAITSVSSHMSACGLTRTCHDIMRGVGCAVLA